MSTHIVLIGPATTMLWGEIPLENLRYVNSLKTLIMDVSHLGSKAPEQAWLVGKAKVEVLEVNVPGFPCCKPQCANNT